MSATYPGAQHLYQDIRDGLPHLVSRYRSFRDIQPVPVVDYVRGAVFFAYFTHVKRT